MRSILLPSGAVLIAAAMLLCCAAATEDAPPGLDPAEGSAPDATTDAEVARADADADAAHEGFDAGGCSPDDWCRVPLPTKDLDLKAVWSFGPADAIAVGETGMIHWDGKAWSVVPGGDGGLEGLSSLWASGPNDVWAVAQGQRRLVHGTRAPGGTFTWSTTEATRGPTRDTVTGVTAGDLWLTGLEDDGTPKISHGVSGDGGVPAFTDVPISQSPFPLNSLSALFVTANDELWLAASTNAAVVLHARKSGASFVWDQSLSTAGQPYTSFPALWGSAANELFVIGARTDNYHRSALADGGAAWAPVANHANTALTAIWGSSKSDVWAVGYLGAVRHWDGTTWKLSQLAVDGLPIYENLSAVHGSGPTDVWAVGPGVALHHTGVKR
jgi:hypothetical protein